MAYTCPIGSFEKINDLNQAFNAIAAETTVFDVRNKTLGQIRSKILNLKKQEVK